MKPHPTIADAYTAECPQCGEPNSVRARAGEKPVKVGVCAHYKRAWRVAANPPAGQLHDRIRAEFTATEQEG
jgi:hypothetical protein